MIRYPSLQAGAVMGTTAPSSGVPTETHALLKLAVSRMESKGFKMVCGDTVWTQAKAASAPAKVRAAEFNQMMADESIQLIIPPWGGELLIEILENIAWDQIKNKWILGYSDISVLLLAVTLKTGIATAHGTNLIDLRGGVTDETTGKWPEVLAVQVDESILQHSSSLYQKEWNFAEPSPCVFHLTEPTCWKSVSGTDVHMRGRLLGGCIDVIRHLIGTPFGDVRHFQQYYTGNEPILWYLENCEMSVTDLRRSLVQMKLAGWFHNSAGLMFGRSAANRPVEDYTVEDVYRALSEELQIPVIYDIDCGHVPPQLTFINGAYAEAELKAAEGSGSVKQTFKP
ncbi:S66 peptidase family protein [Paenibacillus graminis]|uniref:S66 family peptidase n=1 Tax=Paenibacillus graminis TaxID=189425 RepID=UPI002DB8CF1B|nr:S66 peptidase family protein [Paenibacillus graminis]MEC0172463.1 LD-carboxypeptidase [Paenibacillus graminis]